MTMTTVLETLANHGARIRSVEHSQEKTEGGIEAINGKIDGLKNLIIGTLITAVFGLLGTLGSILLAKH